MNHKAALVESQGGSWKVMHVAQGWAQGSGLEERELLSPYDCS